MAIGSMSQWRSRSVVALAASAVYLYGFPSANIPYIALVLFHLVTGIFLTILLLPFLVKLLRTSTPGAGVGWLLLAVGGRDRRDADFYGHAFGDEVVALFAHSGVFAGRDVTCRIVARVPRMARNGRRRDCFAVRGTGGGGGGNFGGDLVVQNVCLEQRLPHHESGDLSVDHG